jgi:hypothetical protein
MLACMSLPDSITQLHAEAIPEIKLSRHTLRSLTQLLVDT